MIVIMIYDMSFYYILNTIQRNYVKILSLKIKPFKTLKNENQSCNFLQNK